VTAGVDTDVVVDPDATRAGIEHVFAMGWSDGLPTLPATDEHVAEFLAHTTRDPDEVIATIPQLGKSATVRHAAVGAAMAGCAPEYFPVVLAAWDALGGEKPAQGGGWQSTSSPSPMLVVNGDIRNRLGFNSTGGVLGPGFRPNATIPRAIGLTISNIFGIRPHVLDQGTQGVPGRWQMCVAEAEEDSPWEPLSVELGHSPGADALSTVMVRTTEFLDNRYYTSAEEVLLDFADSVRRTGSWIMRHSAVGLLLNPEHAWLFADAGYSKQDVRDWLYENAVRTQADLRAVGKEYAVGTGHPDDEVHHVLADSSPASIPIVVAGSRNAAMSAIFRVFTTWSGRVVPIG